MRHCTYLLAFATGILLLACSASSSPNPGAGGSGGEDGEGGSSAGGNGGGSATLTWAQHCQLRGEALAACEGEPDVADCTKEGPCFEATLRADAVQPFLQCRVQQACLGGNCNDKAAANLSITNVQQSYVDAANQRVSCENAGLDWDWSPDNFPWKILSDAFLQDLIPCLDISSCPDADACLRGKYEAAFAACQ
ncbi:hypothetical protein [Polyangium sp. 6x1]|uniref:hypothetical protein n=1 Tax=Polyangium sp. 6x1 TaxID=3042689 RepID=UPI002482C2A9|nr:hypothetical protein [Polyangium sp. 6x1]MDI1444277.1 hypothetical protein [Polyangium sp. 6x1]